MARGDEKARTTLARGYAGARHPRRHATREYGLGVLDRQTIARFPMDAAQATGRDSHRGGGHRILTKGVDMDDEPNIPHQFPQAVAALEDAAQRARENKIAAFAGFTVSPDGN